MLWKFYKKDTNSEYNTAKNSRIALFVVGMKWFSWLQNKFSNGPTIRIDALFQSFYIFDCN